MSGAPTRSLLTSLSPLASYTLGHALGLGENGNDHASTLFHPPRAKLIRAVLPSELTRSNDEDAQDTTVPTAAAAASAAPISRHFALYTFRNSVLCRSISGWLDAHSDVPVYSAAFNATPRALAVDDAATTEEDEEGRRPWRIRALIGFETGAVMMCRPFSEVWRGRTGSSNAEQEIDDPLEQDRSFNITPVGDHQKASSAATAPCKVNCLAWVPVPPVASSQHDSSPSPASSTSSPRSTHFVVGLSDGRLLVYDTRIPHGDEKPLEHPSPGLTKPEWKAKRKLWEVAATAQKGATQAPVRGPVYQKELFSVVYAASSPSSTASTPTNHSSKASTTNSGSGLHSQTGASPMSNPVASWKMYALPSSAPTSILCLAFSPSGSHLALSLSCGRILILDWTAQKLLGVFDTRYGNVTCMEWTTDERYLVTGGRG
jgi:hypothetical protein